MDDWIAHGHVKSATARHNQHFLGKRSFGLSFPLSPCSTESTGIGDVSAILYLVQLTGNFQSFKKWIQGRSLRLKWRIQININICSLYINRIGWADHFGQRRTRWRATLEWTINRSTVRSSCSPPKKKSCLVKELINQSNWNWLSFKIFLFHPHFQMDENKKKGRNSMPAKRTYLIDIPELTLNRRACSMSFTFHLI